MGACSAAASWARAVRVEIFDNRVEIESPGRFPGLVDPNDPQTITRFARNPRVARVCADLHFGQDLGEGIRRIYEEMRFAGLADPVYEQTSGSVRQTLSSTPVDREIESRLPPGGRERFGWSDNQSGPAPATSWR